jgi:hypothetical protein
MEMRPQKEIRMHEWRRTAQEHRPRMNVAKNGGLASIEVIGSSGEKLGV